MSYYLIISVAFLSVCVLIGFVTLLKRTTFITFSKENDLKKEFKRCFQIPFFVSLAEFFLSLSSLILVFCDCGIINGKMNEKSQIWGVCLLIGFSLGFIIGLMYWIKIKKPFFKNNFHDEYDKYIQNVADMWVRIRVSYYELATIGNFLWPLYAVGTLLGILLSYLM